MQCCGKYSKFLVDNRQAGLYIAHANSASLAYKTERQKITIITNVSLIGCVFVEGMLNTMSSIVGGRLIVRKTSTP